MRDSGRSKNASLSSFVICCGSGPSPNPSIFVSPLFKIAKNCGLQMIVSSTRVDQQERGKAARILTNQGPRPQQTKINRLYAKPRLISNFFRRESKFQTQRNGPRQNDRGRVLNPREATVNYRNLIFNIIVEQHVSLKEVG